MLKLKNLGYSTKCRTEILDSALTALDFMLKLKKLEYSTNYRTDILESDLTAFELEEQKEIIKK